jgi:hypothetical protein
MLGSQQVRINQNISRMLGEKQLKKKRLEWKIDIQYVLI